jgi:hypothetical protein
VLNFKQQLLAMGYEDGTDSFYRTVATVFGQQFPGLTDEQLKRRPREALRFCDLVRAKLGLVLLSDELILAALENYRKNRKRRQSVST